MANLYIYGCSFSYGHGVYYHPKLKPFMYWGFTFQDWYWGNQIADKYGYNLINRADGGAANDTTVNRILKDSINYESGDLVIIGITKEDRLTLEPFREKSWLNRPYDKETGSPMFPDINVGETTQFLAKTEKQKEKYVEIKNTLIYDGESSVEEWDLLHTNHLYWYQKKENQEIYKAYYYRMFDNLQNLINRLGVRVIIWDTSYWDGSYEKIRQWLEPIPNIDERLRLDSHWSPNGNTHMAMEIAHSIDNNIDKMQYKPREKDWYMERSPYFKEYVKPIHNRTLI